jgi:hypothetical protein
MRTSIVVSNRTTIPGAGYFDIFDQLGIQKSLHLSYWWQQLIELGYEKFSNDNAIDVEPNPLYSLTDANGPIPDAQTYSLQLSYEIANEVRSMACIHQIEESELLNELVEIGLGALRRSEKFILRQ